MKYYQIHHMAAVTVRTIRFRNSDIYRLTNSILTGNSEISLTGDSISSINNTDEFSMESAIF